MSISNINVYIMRKETRFVALLAMLFMFVACSEDGGNSPVSGGMSDGVYYVLNSGDWKSNNSSITRYDASTGVVIQGYFESVNGRKLGNTANDMIVYGDKMYIAVAGEGTIEIAGLGAKSIKQIECGAQPRYLAAHGEYVYVTYFDGYVAKLDTASLQVVDKVKVGRNPEQLAVCGGKLFVANSGGMDYNTELGYDNTVSVIDLTSFSEVDKLEVVVNPANVVSDGEGVYVASYGNYADVPSALQYISAGAVGRDLPAECSSMTEICYNSGVLYGYSSKYDANWNAVTTYVSFDRASGTVDSPWIKEAELPVPYKVCAVGEYICVTSSDYINDGDVWFYDTDGMLVAKIVAGLNPVKAVVVE